MQAVFSAGPVYSTICLQYREHMQSIEQLASLDPYERTRRLDGLIEQYIHKNGKGDQYEALPEDQRRAYLENARGVVAEKAPQLFQVQVSEAKPLKIKTPSGNEYEGTFAQRYLESNLPKSGRARSRAKQDVEIIQEAQPARTRPLYDQQTEYLISAIRKDEVKPSDFNPQEIEEIIPVVRQAVPEKADQYISVIRDQLSREGIEPGSFTMKSMIRGMVPKSVEDFADKVFEGIDNFDGTTNEQYQRWRNVYGDIDEDFRTIGAVAGVAGGGAGSGAFVNGIFQPGKVRLLSKLVAMGAVDSAYTEQLPGISAELLNVKDEKARKALTFAEGMALAGMFDMGTAVARRLVGKDMNGARKVLLENGAQDIDGKLTAEGQSIARSLSNEAQVRKRAQEALKPTPEGFELLPQTKLGKAYQQARVVLQDPYKPIKDLQRQPGIQIPDDASDPYLAKRMLMPDTLQMQKAVEDDFTDVVRKVQQFEADGALPDGKGYELVNKYLESLHAPERNKFLNQDGAAGMTNAEAKELKSSIENRGDFKKIKSIADEVQTIHKRTLDYLLEGELISEKTHKELRNRWKNHVPLNRVMDDLDDEGIIQVMSGGGPGASVQSSGLKKAKGSQREVLPIVDNVYSNLMGAVRRSQRNLANLSAYDFYQNNKSQLGDLMEVKPASAVKGSKDLVFFKNGKKLALTIKDPKLSAAFQHIPQAETNPVIRTLLAMNRYLGAIYTKFNPDFPAPNKIRDMTEASANAIRSSGIKGGLRSLVRAPADMKAIIDHSRGLDTPAAKRYQALIDAGGSTGGLGHMAHSGITDTFERLQKNKAKSVRGYLKNVDDIIDKVNMVFEDSTRLSVFESALASGKSPKQAALAARDSSFDPLLRGTGGNALSSLYLFFNPAVQSATNMGRTLANPKTGLPVMGALLGSQIAIDRWNRSIDPDYRSKLSPYERGKTLPILLRGEGEDIKKLTIPLGYGLLPLKVANDYAIDLFNGKATDDFATAVARIGASMLEGYNPLGGGSPDDFLVPTVPGLFVATGKKNQDGLGNDIRPPWLESKNIAQSEKFFDYTAETRGGQFAIALARKLDEVGMEVNPENMMFWYRNLTGGPGKTVKNLFGVASKLYNGEAPDPNEIPIWRRFYSVTPEELATYRSEQDDSIEKLEKVYLTEKHKRQQQLRVLSRKLVEPETMEERIDAYKQLYSIVSQHPNEQRYVENRIKQEMLDLSSDDRRIKRFSINDGGRAKLYLNLIENMTEVEAKEFLRDQRKKKLLTDKVYQQMMYYRSGGR